MVKSTKPKGATSYKETAFGIIPRSKLIELEKEGIKKAQEYIIQLSKNGTKITPELILEVHKTGFGWIFPYWAGKFRTIDVNVGNYEPPHYSRIFGLIKLLFDDLEERFRHLPSPKEEEQFLAEVISLVAWFQHRFVWIHPFQDYNGRIARLLTNLILLNLGLPIASIKADTDKDRETYIKSLKQADKRNYVALENLLANALKESLEKI